MKIKNNLSNKLTLKYFFELEFDTQVGEANNKNKTIKVIRDNKQSYIYSYDKLIGFQNHLGIVYIKNCTARCGGNYLSHTTSNHISNLLYYPINTVKFSEYVKLRIVYNPDDFDLNLEQHKNINTQIFDIKEGNLFLELKDTKSLISRSNGYIPYTYAIGAKLNQGSEQYFSNLKIKTIIGGSLYENKKDLKKSNIKNIYILKKYNQNTKEAFFLNMKQNTYLYGYLPNFLG